MPQNFAQWNVGDVILELYKVTDVLGEGGFGKVYKVRHSGWNIDLAVKITKPEIVEAAGGVENFEREAGTWVNLGLHPHTVSCYYVRRINSIPVVFAEYVAGGSLHDWIYSSRLYAGGTEISLKRILDIAIQFAWGLHYAHEQGLIHQDVKPSNVMMTAEGTVKVTDFGLANALSMATVANNKEREPQASKVADSTLMVAGSGSMTPAYCSPEQANGNNLTRRTDLWSWALSVLEMFQGERTWAHGTVAASALEYYLESGSENLQLPQMPILLAQLLRRCFRENPSERPHDMLEVANEVQSIYQQTTGKVYPQQQPQTAKDIASSLNNRAVSLFDLGKEGEALQVWEQALQIQPQHTESTYNRGLILWRKGEINDLTLVAALNDVERSYFGDWNVRYLLALVHLERNEYEAVIKTLEGTQSQIVQQEEVKIALALAKEQDNRLRSLLNIFEGHTRRVTSVCLSNNSKFALSGSHDQTLKFWELDTGSCLRTFEGHAKSITSLYLSANNQLALSGSSDNTLKLWEVRTGRCLHTCEGHTGDINSVCLSANNQLALSGSGDNTLKLWEVRTGRCLHTFDGHTISVTSVYLSGNNRFALSGSRDRTLKLWEVGTGRCLWTFEGHTDDVTSVCLSTNNKFALSGSRDKTLKLWEVGTGRCLRTFEGHTSSVASIHLSVDEQLVLSGSHDDTLKLWKLSTGCCLHTFKGNTHSKDSMCLGEGNEFIYNDYSRSRMWAVNCLTNFYLAPMILSQIVDSQTILYLNRTYTQGLEQAQIALSTEDYIAAAEHIRKVRSLPGYSRDAEALKIWKELYIRLPRKTFLSAWEIRSFKRHTYNVASVYLSRDNQFALSRSSHKIFKLWDISTGKCLRVFRGHTDDINSICLSSNNQFALSGSADKTLKLWDTSTGKCQHIFEGHTNGITSVCLSADNKFALSGSNDCTLKVWEISTGECLRTFKGHASGIVSVCLSANNKFALSGSDKTIKVWEVATGKCLRTFEGNTSGILCLSANNKYALSASGKIIKVWEVLTGRCIRIFEGHTKLVSSVCLSHDDRYALSGSYDKTIKLWEVATGKCLRTIEGHAGGISSVFLSNDSQLALSGSYDKTFKLWFLDWELEDKLPANWDMGAQPYLENFLTLYSSWSEEDFENLLYNLSCAGYTWLRSEGVRHQLKIMTKNWKWKRIRIQVRRNIFSLLGYLYFEKIPSIKLNTVKKISIIISKLKSPKDKVAWKYLAILLVISVLILIHISPLVTFAIFLYFFAFIFLYYLQEMLIKIFKK